MVKFSRKTTSGQGGIGHHLKNARRALGLSVDEIAEATKIRKPLLLALEQSAFHEIEEPFYRAIIVKTYSEYVGLDWRDVGPAYERESAYIPKNRSHAPASASAIQRRDLWVASRIAKNIFLAGAIGGACAYLAFLAFVALQPPTLTVQNPLDNLESSSHTVLVRGAVKGGESDIRINGQRVLKRGDGSFEREVTLSSGVNVIQVAAAKKYSKESVITRTVVYQEPTLPNP